MIRTTHYRRGEVASRAGSAAVVWCSEAARLAHVVGSVRDGATCVYLAGTIGLVGCACGVAVGIGSLCKRREHYQLMPGGFPRSHGNTYHHFRWPIRAHRCLFVLKSDL